MSKGEDIQPSLNPAVCATALQRNNKISDNEIWDEHTGSVGNCGVGGSSAYNRVVIVLSSGATRVYMPNINRTTICPRRYGGAISIWRTRYKFPPLSLLMRHPLRAWILYNFQLKRRGSFQSAIKSDFDKQIFHSKRISILIGPRIKIEIFNVKSRRDVIAICVRIYFICVCSCLQIKYRVTKTRMLSNNWNTEK